MPHLHSFIISALTSDTFYPDHCQSPLVDCHDSIPPQIPHWNRCKDALLKHKSDHIVYLILKSGKTCPRSHNWQCLSEDENPVGLSVIHCSPTWDTNSPLDVNCLRAVIISDYWFPLIFQYQTLRPTYQWMFSKYLLLEHTTTSIVRSCDMWIMSIFRDFSEAFLRELASEY